MALSADSLHLITGSRDTSLKVWQLAGGKLAQVSALHLIPHEPAPPHLPSCCPEEGPGEIIGSQAQNDMIVATTDVVGLPFVVMLT